MKANKDTFHRHNDAEPLPPTPLPGSIPEISALSSMHPPPTIDSSATDVLQRSFDTFNTLDYNDDRTLGVDQLKAALNLFAHLPDEPDAVPVVSPDDARAVMDIVAGPTATTLSFSQFHNVYSAVNILHQLSKQDLPHLRVKDVKRALIAAGIVPTQSQLDAMMVLGDAYSTFDKRGRVDIKEFLRIYTQARTSATHVFLHSWFYAGRNSTAMRKPVEMSPFQDFLAGTTAGVSLTLVGHPFDTIKVRLQTQTGYKGGLDCLIKTVRGEGFLSLFKGMSGPLCTIPLVNAIVFWSYATAKQALHKMQTEVKPLNLFEITMAGMFAGLVNCVVICPVELIKTRLQVQYEPHVLPSPKELARFALKRSLTASNVVATAAAGSFTAAAAAAGPLSVASAFRLGPLFPALPSAAPPTPYLGPIDCIRRTVQHGGIAGLYRGFAATVYREVPAYGGQFFSYEAMKRMMTPPGEKGNDLHPVKLLLAGGVAGTVGWCLSYPMDFVKSQLQSEPLTQRSVWRKHPTLLDGGFFDCWRRTVSEHGWKAVWRGFGPCLARAFPANAAGFVTYELSLKFLRKYDTV